MGDRTLTLICASMSLQRHVLKIAEGEGGHENLGEAGFERPPSGLFGPVAVVILPLPRELYDENGVFRGQTDQHHEADLCEDVYRHTSEVRPVAEASKHIGTISTMANGSFQPLLLAARTRNTNRADAAKIASVGTPRCSC